MTLRNKLVAPALYTSDMTFRPATDISDSSKDLSALARMAERRAAKEEAEAQREFQAEENRKNREARSADAKEAKKLEKDEYYAQTSAMVDRLWDASTFDKRFNAATKTNNYAALKDIKVKTATEFRQGYIKEINKLYGEGSAEGVRRIREELEPAVYKFMQDNSLPPDFAGRERSKQGAAAIAAKNSRQLEGAPAVGGTGLRSPAKRGSADSGNGPKFLTGAASFLPTSFAEAGQSLKDIAVADGAGFVQGVASYIEDPLGSAYEFIEGAVTEASAYREAHRQVRARGGDYAAAAAAGNKAAMAEKTRRRETGEDEDNFLLVDARAAREDAARLATNLSPRAKATLKKINEGDTSDFLDAFSEAPLLTTSYIISGMAPAALTGGGVSATLRAMGAGAKLISTGFAGTYAAAEAGAETQRSNSALSKISDADFIWQPAFLEAKEILGPGASNADARTLAEQWLTRTAAGISAGGAVAGLMVGGLTERVAARAFQNALKIGATGGARGAAVSAGREALGESIEGFAGSIASDVGSGREVDYARAGDAALKGALVGGALGGAISAGSQLRNRSKVAPDDTGGAGQDETITPTVLAQAESDLKVISDAVDTQRAEMAEILYERDVAITAENETNKTILMGNDATFAAQELVNEKGATGFREAAAADPAIRRMSIASAEDSAISIDPDHADVSIEQETGNTPASLKGARIIGEQSRILQEKYDTRRKELAPMFSSRGAKDADIPLRVNAMQVYLTAQGFDPAVAQQVASELAPARRKELPFYADRAAEISPEHALAAQSAVDALTELRDVERRRAKLGTFRKVMAEGRGTSGDAFVPDQEAFDAGLEQLNSAVADIVDRGGTVRGMRQLEGGVDPANAVEEMMNGGALLATARREALRNGSDSRVIGNSTPVLRLRGAAGLERVRQRAAAGVTGFIPSIQEIAYRVLSAIEDLDFSNHPRAVDEYLTSKTGENFGIGASYESAVARVENRRADLLTSQVGGFQDSVVEVANKWGVAPSEVLETLHTISVARQSQYHMELWPLYHPNLLNDSARGDFMALEASARSGAVDPASAQQQMLAIGNDPANYTKPETFIPLDQRTYFDVTYADAVATVRSRDTTKYADDFAELERQLQLGFTLAREETARNGIGGAELERVYDLRSVDGYYYPLKTDFKLFGKKQDEAPSVEDVNLKNGGRSSMNGSNRSTEDADMLVGPVEALQGALSRAAYTGDQIPLRKLAASVQKLTELGGANVGFLEPVRRTVDPKTGKVSLENAASVDDTNAFTVWNEDGTTAVKLTLTNSKIADLLRGRDFTAKDSELQKVLDGAGKVTGRVARAAVNFITFLPKDLPRMAFHNLATAIDESKGTGFSAEAAAGTARATRDYGWALLRSVYKTPSLTRFWLSDSAGKAALRPKLEKTEIGRMALEYYDHAGQSSYKDLVRLGETRKNVFAAEKKAQVKRDSGVEPSKVGSGLRTAAAAPFKGVAWVANNAVDINDGVLTSADMTFRLATYVAMRKGGATVERAADRARGTFNYRQQIGAPGGALETSVRNANSLYMFTRAMVIGTTKAVNKDVFRGGTKRYSFTEDDAGQMVATGDYSLRNLSPVMTSAMALAGIAGAAGGFALMDDDELATHDAAKLITGFGYETNDGDVNVLEQQYGVNQMFHALGASAYLYMRGTHSAEALTRALVGKFGKNIAPLTGAIDETEDAVDAETNGKRADAMKYVAKLSPSALEPLVSIATGVRANGYTLPGLDYQQSQGWGATYKDKAPYKSAEVFRAMQEETGVPAAAWETTLSGYGGASVKAMMGLARWTTRLAEDPSYKPDGTLKALLGSGSTVPIGSGADNSQFYSRQAGAIASAMYDITGKYRRAEGAVTDGDTKAIDTFLAAHPGYETLAIYADGYKREKNILEDEIELLQAGGASEQDQKDIRRLRSQLMDLEKTFVEDAASAAPKLVPVAAFVRGVTKPDK